MIDAPVVGKAQSMVSRAEACEVDVVSVKEKWKDQDSIPSRLGACLTQHDGEVMHITSHDMGMNDCRKEFTMRDDNDEEEKGDGWCGSGKVTNR